MNCGNCGYPLEKNADFCSNCGNRITKENINNNYLNNQPKNNHNNKTLIIIISIVLGTFLLITLGIIIGKNFNRENTNNTDNDSNNVKLDNDTSKIEEYTFDLYDTNMQREVKDEKELSKNIEIYKIFFNPKSTSGKTKEAYVYGKNNNNTSVKVKAEVEYYDSEGYRLDSDANIGTIVKANSEFVLQIYVKDDSLNYKMTKLLYSAKKVESYYTEISMDELEVNDTLFNDGNINVTIKNNSSIELKSAYLGCVYYKDGKEVFATDGSTFDIKTGETGQAKFYSHKLFLKPYDSSQKIEYDDYKVFLYSAFNYDTENYQ